MFCPKCGTSMPENSMKCSNCSFEISEVGMPDTSEKPAADRSSEQANVSNTQNTAWDNLKKFVFPAIGFIVLIMCFTAAASISSGGTEIMQISSVGGRTLEEAYYRELGTIYSGYANIARAVGLSLASFLVWLGFKK